MGRSHFREGTWVRSGLYHLSCRLLIYSRSRYCPQFDGFKIPSHISHYCPYVSKLTRAWITELQDPGLVYKIRTIATYSSSHRPQPFEVDVELLLELARAGGAAVLFKWLGLTP